MPIEILLPAVAPSVTEGNIVRWAKKEGDSVRQGEVLLELETDKAVVEIQAEHDGVLGKILVPEGTNGVKVDTVIALLAVNGENAESLAGASGTARAPTSTSPAGTSRPQAAPPADSPASSGASGVPARTPGERIFASPLARRIAKELSVDLARVSGRGPNGRVLKADVEAAARAGSAAAVRAPAEAYEDVPHSNTRRVIAQRLAEAKRSVPHFYLTIDCDVDALLAARAKANEMVDGLKLSLNDLVIKAVAMALRKVPAVNAAWTEGAVRRFREVDVAVAVATPHGLVTPVVRNADAKTVRQISAEMKDFVARAQESRVRPDEYQGGGFTVSNLGMFGIREFAAIINPPQVCVLAVGASEQRAVVRGGALAAATLMTCTLSVDHRAVDGALAAQFLDEFKKLIESPTALFL